MKLTRQQRLGLLLTGILLALLALVFALSEPPKAVRPVIVAEPEQSLAPKPKKEKKPSRQAKKRSEPRPAPEPRNPLDEEF